MRAADVITASVLILLGSVVLLDAVRLGIGWGTDGPKSGFFPFWLALIMVLCCATIIAQEAQKRSGRIFAERDKFKLVLKVLWPAAAAITVMQWLGLYVSSALYLAFYMRWVGSHSWLVVLLLSVIVPVSTFIIFELWFYVPMPKGPLETWLGY